MVYNGEQRYEFIFHLKRTCKLMMFNNVSAIVFWALNEMVQVDACMKRAVEDKDSPFNNWFNSSHYAIVTDTCATWLAIVAFLKSIVAFLKSGISLS